MTFPAQTLTFHAFLLHKTLVSGSFRPLDRPNIDRISRLRWLLVAGTQDNIFWYKESRVGWKSWPPDRFTVSFLENLLGFGPFSASGSAKY